MVAALESSLANGLTIGGFTVKTSSVTAVTAGTVDPNIYITQDEATKYRNIAIIVGVVIPISLSTYFNNFSHHFHRDHHSHEERCNLCKWST